MAENLDMHPKEFSVELGRDGDKNNTYGGFYSRVKTIRDAKGKKFINDDNALAPGQNWTGQDETKVLFGLWKKKEEYVWSGRSGEDHAMLFRRTKLTRATALRRPPLNSTQMAG